MVSESFIPVQIDVTREDPQVIEAIERYRQFWTPTIIVLTPEGQEVRRSQGFFPPEEFIPELKLGLGQALMLEKNFAGAFDLFDQVVRDQADSRSVPEAMYWQGVSAYKRDGNAQSLIRYWKELQQKAPESDWWQKASFIAD
jgi:hypothetical protein